MGTRLASRSAQAAGLTFNNVKTDSYENAATVERSLIAPYAGTLTTRTSNTAGVITTTNTPTEIVTNDEVAIGWEDGSGVFQYAYMGTVSGVVGNAITFATLKGTVLPIATYAVRIAKMYKEPVGAVTPATTKFAVGTTSPTGKLLAVLGNASALDSGTTTDAITLLCEGSSDSKFLETVAEYTGQSATFATGDNVYLSNLSLVALGAIVAQAAATRD